MIRVLLVSVLAAQWLGGAERNTREGAEHFAAGRLEEALRAFARARADHPEAPATGLNLAGVQYRLGEDGAGTSGAPGEGEGGPLVEAARGYQAALSEGLDDGLAGDAWFNLGNTLYRAGAFAEAAAAYGETLAADPQDAQARQNLERALLRAEEQQEQEDEPSSEDEQQDPSEDQERDPSGEQDREQDPSGEQDREQDPTGEQDQEQDPTGEQDQEQDPTGEQDREQDPTGEQDREQDPPGEPPPGADSPAGTEPGEVPEVSPEQAERILAALAEVERAFQQDQLEKRRARALRRGRH